MSNDTPHPDRWFGPCPRTIEDEMFESIEAKIRRDAFDHLAKSNRKLIPVLPAREGVCVNTILSTQADDIIVVTNVGRECQIVKLTIGDYYFWGLTDIDFKENASIVSSISSRAMNNFSDYLSFLIDKGFSVYLKKE